MTVSLDPATSRFVAAEGVRFRLWRSDPDAPADNTPALLLHGVPETAICWRDLVPELATDRVVLAPDLKGLGESEVRGPYDVRTLAAEMSALVMHEVDQPVDVVGHDWGGVLALAMTALRPDLIRRLVVINAPYGEVKLSRAPYLVGLAMPAAPEALIGLTGDRMFRGMIKAGWRSEPPLAPEIADHYAASYTQPQRTAAMLGYYRASTRPAMVKALARLARRGGVEQPVPHLEVERSLVIWGAADPVFPVSVGENAVRKLGATSSMVTLPGVGHFAPEEAPAVVVPTIAQFLRAP